jgi:hypothetical protein
MHLKMITISSRVQSGNKNVIDTTIKQSNLNMYKSYLLNVWIESRSITALDLM